MKNTNQSGDAGILTNVQAMRAIAAIMVMIGHAAGIKMGMNIDGLRISTSWFAYAGVDIFFVISGFIVCSVSQKYGRDAKNIGRLRAVWKFISKRAIRIYPIYWIVLLTSVIASSWLVLAPAWVPKQPALDLILLATRYNLFIPPAWSLSYEIYFYVATAAIIFLAPRHIFHLMGLWMAGQATLIAYFHLIGDPDKGVFTNPLIFEFCFGVIIAFLVSKGVSRYGVACAAVGLAWFAGGGAFSWWSGPLESFPRVLTFGAAGAFLIYGCIAMEVSGRFRFPRFLHRLGDASYSIYLWHELLLIGMAEASFALGLRDAMPPRLLFACWVLLTLAFAIGAYAYVEKPIITNLNRLAGKVLRSKKDVEPGPLVEPNPHGAMPLDVKMQLSIRDDVAYSGVFINGKEASPAEIVDQLQQAAAEIVHLRQRVRDLTPRSEPKAVTTNVSARLAAGVVNGAPL